jgi:hypothetical protein
MSKRKADEPQGIVKVRMLSAYAGDGWIIGPGEIAEVDAAEAARLIGLGVAEAA